ncbi:MAG TPA: xanthine dehydrogenase family protein molybdopterin-binding subunit, partial [Chloroflexota bacterium]|nr:xanthine dehydrogenase family protein molybdopterin-binding subunit [Chloroflexota bacterium]
CASDDEGGMTKRVEDPRLLRGQAQFVSDIHKPGMLHMAVFRSPYPHARIRSLKVEAARRSPDVVAVLTGEDVAGTKPMPASEIAQPDFARAVNLELGDTAVWLLAGEHIRYAGEPLAVVVAETRAAAEDARDLIELDAQPLPAVGSQNAFDGPDLYDDLPNNLAVSLSFKRGDPPGQQPACVVRGRFHSCRQGGSAIEGRGALAEADPASGGVTLWTSTQVPHRVRRSVATMLGWLEDRLRVITPDVGGGFGMKTHIANEDALVALCAEKLGRPVRWIADRTEDLLAAAQARDQMHEAELALDAEGHILSFRDDFLVDLGSSSSRTVGIVANSALHAFGPYHMPYIEVSGRGVVTNKPPTAQYRGAGRPEICFALERALDLGARQLGLDPFEIRRRNLIQPEEMPYPQGVPQRDGVPILYDASNYPEVLARALELADQSSWPKLQAETEAAGERFGVGCAAYMEATGRGPSEGARLRVESDGSIHIFTGAAGSGQGHATTLAKICGAVLEIPLERIRLTEGDTGLMPDGVGTFASRTAVVAGNAVHQASLNLREHALATAADRLRLPPSRLRWAEGAAHGENGAVLTLAELSAGFETEFTFRPDTVTWTMGVHVALVGVDPGTGGVRILRYVSVHDGGPSLDETIVDGQMHGGIVQGISGAMLEEFTFDDDGQPHSITMADYMIAGAMEAPEMRLGHVEALGSNPLGIKGVGESGIVPVPAALANAISDALGGAALDATPFKPESVWRAALG